MYTARADVQEPLLEEWYWHTLYFNNWSEASKAREKICRALDQCCDLSPMPFDGHYIVTFSTNYLLNASHQQSLIEIIGSHVDFEAEYNQPGEDAEDISKSVQWSKTEESDAISPKIRMRMANGLCTLCGMRPRASYGLWCVTCKQAHLKSGPGGTSQSDELDLCPLCEKPLADRRLSHKVLLEAGRYLWVSLILIIASLVLTVFVGLVACLGGLCGMLAGFVLWLLED